MAKELLVHSGHQPDLRMHRSLSLSLTLCPRVGNHRDTAGRKPFPPLPTALGCLPARLPDTTNTQQGISTSGLPRCVWGGVGGEGRGLALLLLLRERITQRGEEGERRGEGRAGEVEEEEGRRVWRLPSHTPPLALHQPAFLSFI